LAQTGTPEKIKSRKKNLHQRLAEGRIAGHDYQSN
jgi:hypothetical protein